MHPALTPLPRMPPGAAGPEEYSEHERRNMAAAREYLEIAYDPKRASADAVRHLVAEGAIFEAHSTFPAVHDPLAYAQHHAGACAQPWTPGGCALRAADELRRQTTS
jgi:hypothetical protein